MFSAAFRISQSYQLGVLYLTGAFSSVLLTELRTNLNICEILCNELNKIRGITYPWFGEKLNLQMHIVNTCFTSITSILWKKYGIQPTQFRKLKIRSMVSWQEQEVEGSRVSGTQSHNRYLKEVPLSSDCRHCLEGSTICLTLDS